MAIPDTLTLTLSRVFDAPRENVFRAFADPERMRRWMGPRPVPLDSCEMDFRAGGRYRFGFDFDGNWMYVTGTFEIIQPPEKLVFTWQWEHEPHAESLVTVEFADQGNSTLLTLTHARLANTEEIEGHRYGWENSFDKIVPLLVD